MRRALGRLFKAAGYAAETFASAEDYLAREIFEGPICLILDVRMPGLKGPVRCLKQILKLSRRNRS